jgi:hypothetical protein
VEVEVKQSGREVSPDSSGFVCYFWRRPSAAAAGGDTAGQIGVFLVSTARTTSRRRLRSSLKDARKQRD